MATVGITAAVPAGTVIVSLAEPVSGGVAESVAVTVRVCDPDVSVAVFRE
jgi:hypothetical protein